MLWQNLLKESKSRSDLWIENKHSQCQEARSSYICLLQQSDHVMVGIRSPPTFWEGQTQRRSNYGRYAGTGQVFDFLVGLLPNFDKIEGMVSVNSPFLVSNDVFTYVMIEERHTNVMRKKKIEKTWCYVLIDDEEYSYKNTFELYYISNL